MIKRKNKKKLFKNKALIISIIIFILFISIISIFLIYKPKENTAYFYDKELGNVKITYQKQTIISKITKIFEESVLFSQTSANIGDTISLTDTTTVVLQSPEAILSMSIDVRNHDTTPIQLSRLDDIAIDPPVQLGSVTKTISFTPTVAGKYSAETIYDIYSCNVLDFNACNFPNNYLRFFTEKSKNNITIIDPTPTCNMEDTITGWILDESSTIIDNGKIYKRTKQIVNEACDGYVDGDVEYKTVCDANYKIKDSVNSATEAIGKLSCELIITTQTCTDNSNCTVGFVCDTLTKICLAKECNGNETCTNSTIVLRECVNDRFITPTNNTCPSINQTIQNTTSQYDFKCWELVTATDVETQDCIEISMSNVDLKATFNSTTTLQSLNKTCYNDKYFYGDKIKCKENIIINKEFNWAWVAFILLGVVAVGIIIVVIYTKFIKKRKK